MRSVAGARTRPRAASHLRLVRPGEEAVLRHPRGAAEAATHRWSRRTAVPRTQATSAERSVTLLVLSASSLVLIGLVMVLSASSVSAYQRYGSSFLFFKRQLAYAAVGTVGLVIAARMAYRAWTRLCAPLLLGTIALLVLVLVPAFGTRAGGAVRWIAIGPITVQPSEIAKLAVVVFAAALLSRRLRWLADPRQLALPLVPVIAVIAALVMLQPDLGTTIIVVTSVFVLAFAAGARLRHLALGGLVTGLLGFASMYASTYRWARFTSFLDPGADPQGAGYQVIQSKIALASGGWLGVGLGTSRQKWGYVPNAHTDFIYSIIGEELGIIGALVVLVLLGTLLYAGLRIAVRAPDAFGRLLASGITAWFGVQALANLGAVTGMLPITGVPLPFVSFGGSSLVVSMIAVGILLSIARGRGAGRLEPDTG